MSSAFWVPLHLSVVTIATLPQVTDASHLYLFSQLSSFSPILVIYWWVTNYHSIYWLKSTYVYYLIVSVGQESEHSLLGSLASGNPTKLQSRCDPGQRSHLKIWLGKAHMIRDKIQFLRCHWTEGLSSWSLLARGHPHLPSFATWIFPTWFPASSKCVSQENNKECASQMEVTILFYPI